MKDAYSFDADDEMLDDSYQKERVAYSRTFARAGLDTFIVGAFSGAMGGSDSEEFMCFSDAGEDRCVICEKCGYKANMEVAQSKLSELEPLGLPMEDVETPDKRTIEEVSGFLGIPPERLMKVVINMVDDKPVMVLIRGDQEVMEEKFTGRFGGEWRAAEPHEILEMAGAEAGFIGPVGLKRKDVLIVADESLQPGVDYYSGANRDHYHRSGIVIGGNVHPTETLNLREVKEGEACTECGALLKVVKAIELGHIFKLGKKYSESLGINYLDTEGNEIKVTMGCYGIGVERIMAAAIETHADDYGIVWPVTIAPYQVIVLPLDPRDKELTKAAEKCYNDLWDSGIETMLDDRDQSAGFKFNDADLIGIPVQVIFGLKSFKNGEAEIKIRTTGERKKLPIDGIIPEVAEILAKMSEDIEAKAATFG
jgi:prolyl-tRNA synthetase